MEQIISPADALPGRREAMVIGQQHAVNGNPTRGPWPEGMTMLIFQALQIKRSMSVLFYRKQSWN